MTLKGGNIIHAKACTEGFTKTYTTGRLRFKTG